MIEKKKIRISRARVSDAQEIRQLENAVWGEEVVNKYDSPGFVRFGYVYIAKHKNKIIGAIVSYRTNKNEVYVCDLVVDSKYRKLGIGEKLYRKLLQSVKGTSVVSFVNPNLAPTLALHKKLGGKVIKRIEDVYGLDGNNSGLESGTRLFMKIRN